MDQYDIANTRLISQQIAGTKFKSAKEIVSWMGAMQSQDLNMAKWAIGIRLNKVTEKSIDTAINSGEIMRTHLLRPTWHFVSADDIYWMLELTAPRIKSFMKSSNKLLELTDKILTKSNLIIEKALSGSKHLTRKELIFEINKAKIATDNNRSGHILLNAEMEGIICNGKMNEKQTTYALLNERIKKPKALHKEESLYKLANKYFESHCPAAFLDFVWWSGLSVTDAKHAMQLIKDNFISEKINSREYWFPNSFSIPKKYKESLYLLPAFDDFLISYKDRSAAIIQEHQKKTFSNNGIFWPVIIANGHAVGIWKRELKKDKIIVQANFFEEKNKAAEYLIKKASEKLGYFLNHKIEIAD